MTAPSSYRQLVIIWARDQCAIPDHTCYGIRYPAMDTNTGITIMASRVVYETTAADSSASRLNFVASIVVIAALEEEQAIRHETAML